MARIGRPSKGTPERMAAIVAKVALGVPQEVAARACGVHPATMYRWKAQGERSRSGPFYEFYESLGRAEAAFEADAVAGIQAVAEGGQLLRRSVTRHKDGSETEDCSYTRKEWTAYAWLLERRHRDRWGRTDRVDLRVLSEQVAADESLTPAEREELQRELAAFLSNGK